MCNSKSSIGYLLVGLGALGSAAVCLAEQTFRKFAHHEALQTFRAIGIDTDSSVAEYKNTSTFTALELKTDQFSFVKKNTDHFPAIAKWLPDNLPTSDNGRGTVGSKGLARLAFALNFAEIKQVLADAVAQIATCPNLKTLRVIMSTGLAGGTGAIICDTAYLLRSLVAKQSFDTCFEAVLPLQQSGLDATLAANVYSGLVELNHWMNTNTEWTFANDEEVSLSFKEPPFHKIYLNNIAEFDGKNDRKQLSDYLVTLTDLTFDSNYQRLNSELNTIAEPWLQDADQFGNALSCLELNNAALSMPSSSLNTIIHTRIATQVIKQWLEELFEKDHNQSTLQGQTRAECFFANYTLDVKTLTAKLFTGITTADKGKFDFAKQTAAFTEAQKRKPLFGLPLEAQLKSIQAKSQQLLEGQNFDQINEVLKEKSALIKEECIKGIEQESSSFVNTDQKNCLGFTAFIDELNKQFSFSLNELHENLNSREAEAPKLEALCRDAIDKATAYAPSALKKFMGRIETADCDAALETLRNTYDSALKALAAREAIDIFLGLIQELGQFSNKVSHLKKYLQTAEQSLTSSSTTTFQHLFTAGKEQLISQEAAQVFIEKQCSAESSATTIDKLIDKMQPDLFTLPDTVPVESWIKQIITAIGELYPLPRPHVAQAFLDKYQGLSVFSRLQNLYDSTAFKVTLRHDAPTAGSTLCRIHLETENPAAQEAIATVLQQLKRVKGSTEPQIISQEGSEEIAVTRLRGGFTLGSLETEELRKAYVQSLRLGMRSLHSRRDVQFKALQPINDEVRQTILYALAVGIHLGMLTAGGNEQTRQQNVSPIDRLSSPRWPDLASVKSCLKLYEDHIEALNIENIFLSTLERWRNERIDENGIDLYLKSLTSDLHDFDFLDIPLSESLKGAYRAQEQRLEERWPQWSKDIGKSLEQTPSLNQSDLVTVPRGMRRWAMNRFIQENASDNLAYHASSGILELISARDIETFDKIWLRLQGAREKDSEVFAEESRQLVNFLCQVLGFTADAPIGLGSLNGMSVSIHGMRIKIPKQIPIIINRLLLLNEEDTESLRSIMEQSGLDSRFGLIITMGEGAPNIKVIDERLRRLLRYDVIVLTYEDIRGILKMRSRLKALVTVILRQVDLTVVSPFVTEGPVSDAMFFGREGEIKEILNRLDGSSVAVVGPRRIGKTSILQRVLSSLTKQSRPIIYLDCQSISDNLSFFKTLALEYAPEHAKDDFSSPMAFRELLDVLRKERDDLPLLFILDEVDLLLREDPQGAESLFRAFKTANLDKSANFLVCGERTLLQKIKDGNSALYNFCYPIRMRFLEPKDAAHLITEPLEQMEITWENKQAFIDRILEVTSGHPNLIQRTCAAMVECLNDEHTRVVKDEYLNRVVSDPDFAENYLDTLWGRADELEKIICLSWVDENGHTSADIRSLLENRWNITVKAKDIAEAAENLYLYGILEKQGATYHLAATYLPKLLSEFTDIEEEIQINKEMITNGG